MDNKAVIYARYSSDSQNVASIQQQIKACTDRALSDSRCIVHVYTDKATSGRTMDKREGLRQLMQDATKQNCSQWCGIQDLKIRLTNLYPFMWCYVMR